MKTKTFNALRKIAADWQQRPGPWRPEYQPKNRPFEVPLDPMSRFMMPLMLGAHSDDPNTATVRHFTDYNPELPYIAKGVNNVLNALPKISPSAANAVKAVTKGHSETARLLTDSYLRALKNLGTKRK